MHSSECLNFLKSYFRVFSTLVTQITKPQMIDNVEHKLRNVVIGILNRLPYSASPFYARLAEAVHACSGMRQ